MKLYGVRDEIAEEFGSIGMAKNHNAAMREFLKQLTKNDLNEKEFGIYYLGDFDMENGEIIQETPMNLKELIIDTTEEE